MPTSFVPAGLALGSVALLLDAFECASDVRYPVWQFAVKWDDLQAAGTTLLFMQWLIAKGFVDHQFEITFPGDQERIFRPIGKLNIRPRSCFVLTSAGVEFAR